MARALLSNTVRLLAVGILALSSCNEESPPLGSMSAPVFGGAIDTSTEAVVALLDGPVDGPHNICSAVVIGPRVLLTAAHCVDDPAKKYHVRLGSAVATSTRSIDAASVHVYPSYREPGEDQRAGYDLAVVLLAEDASVTPVALAREDAIAEGELVDVIGFGQRDPIDLSSTGVRYRARVPVVTACDRLLGTGDETHGFCGGDSGGAVLRGGALVGVIGFGVRPQCAPPGWATRVVPYSFWIDSFVRGAPDEACALCPPPGHCPATQPDAGTTRPSPSPQPGAEGGCRLGRSRSSQFALLLALLLLRMRTRRQ